MGKMSILKQLRHCMKILLKNRKTPYHLTCHAAVHRDTKTASALPNKILELSLRRQMQRYHDVSVSSDRYIRDPKFTKFTVPFRTNRFIDLLFVTYVENKQLARFDRKMSFHFPRVFSLVSDQSVWRQRKHPEFNKYHDQGIMPVFFYFFAENLSWFVKRDPRPLEARSLGLHCTLAIQPPALRSSKTVERQVHQVRFLLVVQLRYLLSTVKVKLGVIFSCFYASKLEHF